MAGHATILDCGCHIAPGGGRTWCPTCEAGHRAPARWPDPPPEISRAALRQLAELANEWAAGEGSDEFEPGYTAGRVDAARELVNALEHISGCRLQVTGTGIAPSIIGEPR